jgi:hypothetical protein
MAKYFANSPLVQKINLTLPLWLSFGLFTVKESEFALYKSNLTQE